MDRDSVIPGSFLPRFLARRRNPRAGLGEPQQWLVPGAVLLTDIHGFTTLVENEANTRVGLEDLSRDFNEYFTDIIEIVYAHGGDVLSVAGDGLLCFWEAEDTARYSDAAERARRAAFEIRDSPRISSRRTFPTRAAISAGPVSLALVGGLNGVWELVTTGLPIQQVVEASRGIAAGEVWISSAASEPVDVAGESPRSDIPTRPGAVRIAEAESPLAAGEGLSRGEWHAPWIPEHVRARLLAAPPEWAAEVRHVTVLHTRVGDVGRLSPAALEELHRSVGLLQETAVRLEAGLWLRVDEKGIIVLMAFGLPGMSHGNEAERAILAAKALLKGEVTEGTRAGIGIASGPAFCGVFGSQRRREYTLHGDVVNAAAALMQSASHEILCHYTTAELVRGRYAFEVLPPIAVKGKHAAIPVCRPLERVDRSSSTDSELVGRAAERMTFAAALDQLKGKGGSHAVSVEGEPGIGKSRLITEVEREAGAKGVRVLLGAGDPMERSTPYFAWRSVFGKLFALPPEVDAAEATRRILGWYPEVTELQHLLPLLTSILPVSLADNARTREMAGPIRAENTRRLLHALLAAAATREPTVLIIEDTHWLDSASLALLKDTVATIDPLLTVMTARSAPDQWPTSYAELLRHPRLRRVFLQGLAPDEMRLLITRFLGISEVPQELLEFLQERVAGNPFFCEELIRAMRESGVVRIVGDRCVVGELSGSQHPTTIEAAILSRLDRLEPREQLCIKIASVIGREFLGETVKQVFPVDDQRREVSESLDVLCRTDLIRAREVDFGGAYAFKHAITREVTYGLLPAAIREPVHRAVAEWYEERYAKQLAPHLPLLSHHWAAAGEPTKATHYLGLSGDQALERGAYKEAAHLLAEAMRTWEAEHMEVSLEERVLWEKGLARAHFHLGDLNRSQHYLGRAISLLHRPVLDSSWAAARGVAREVFRQVLHRIAPARYFGRRAKEQGALNQAVEGYKILGQIYYLNADPPVRLIYATLAGLNLGEEVGPSRELAHILTNTATLLSLLGLFRLADGYAERAIKMAEAEPQRSAAAYVWHIHALMLAQRGDWVDAQRANDRALELIQEFRDYNLEAEAWLVRSTILRCQGRYSEAPPVWTRGRNLAKASGNSQFECWTYLDEVHTLLEAGDTEGATRALDRALEIPTAATDGSSTVGKQWALAVTRFAQRRISEAIEAAGQVVDAIVTKRPTGYHMVEYGADAVEICLRALEHREESSIQNVQALQRRATQGCRRLKRLSRAFPHISPRALRLQGILYWQRGDAAAALRSWRRAAIIAEERRMEIERARALALLWRHDPEHQADACLHTAAEIFRRHGATVSLRRLENDLQDGRAAAEVQARSRSPVL